MKNGQDMTTGITAQTTGKHNLVSKTNLQLGSDPTIHTTTYINSTLYISPHFLCPLNTTNVSTVLNSNYLNSFILKATSSYRQKPKLSIPKAKSSYRSSTSPTVLSSNC